MMWLYDNTTIVNNLKHDFLISGVMFLFLWNIFEYKKSKFQQ